MLLIFWMLFSLLGWNLAFTVAIADFGILCFYYKCALMLYLKWIFSPTQRVHGWFMKWNLWESLLLVFFYVSYSIHSLLCFWGLNQYKSCEEVDPAQRRLSWLNDTTLVLARILFEYRRGVQRAFHMNGLILEHQIGYRLLQDPKSVSCITTGINGSWCNWKFYGSNRAWQNIACS